MTEKSPEAFRTISEVADWLGVPTHVLRFWESRFSQVKPVKRAGGRRYYRPTDMELLGGIRRLLHDDGMTIRGVQKLLREKGVRHVAGLSPALDEPAEMRDVTPDNVVELPGREEEEEEVAASEPGETAPSELEPADLLAEPEAAPAESLFDLPGPAAPETAEGEPAEPPEVAEPAGPGAESGPAEAEPAEAASLEPETGEAAEEPAPQASEAPEPLVLGAGDASPEELDFSAHDGQPGTFETEAPGAAPPVEPSEEAGAVEELDFAAHGSEPETAEDAPAPSLEMPPIGPDPDDGAVTADMPLVAARLRAARAVHSRVNTASLQALADRLEEIDRRLRNAAGARPGL